MRYLSLRLGITRPAVTRQIIIGFACLTMLFRIGSADSREATPGADSTPRPEAIPQAQRTPQGRSRNTPPPSQGQPQGQQAGTTTSNSTGGAQAKPIQVHVVWLDKETAVLAFRSPQLSKRIVLGIANPSLDEGQPGNLYEIPGFKDAVPTKDLESFRAVLTQRVTIPPQNKYEILRYSSVATTYPLSDVEPTFLDYVRNANIQPGDVEVWDVSTPTIRVVFLGDLVLVKPAQISNAQHKAEDALALVLTNLAFKENEGTRSASLTKGCSGALTDVENVRQDPTNVKARQNLLSDRSRGLNGSGVADNTYEVTNSGWVQHVLHLDFKPNLSAESNFQVTAVVGAKDETISGPRDLEIPPCEVAQISIAPPWYYVFPDKVVFTYDNSKLNATIPEPRFRWNWIIGAGVTIFVLLLAWLFLPLKQSKPHLDEDWASRVKAGREIKPMREGIITGKSFQDQSSRRGGRLLQRFRKKFHRTDDGQLQEYLNKAAQTPDKDAWQIVLQNYEESSATLLAHVRASLPRLQTADETIQQLETVTKDLEDARTEHKRWQDELQSLGKSPDEINEKATKQQERIVTLCTGIQKVQSSLSDVGATDGEQRNLDPDLDLDDLADKVSALKKLKDDYNNAALQVVAVLDPAAESRTVKAPVDLALMFKQIRGVLNQVLRNYAERLRTGTDTINFEKHSLAQIEQKLPEMKTATEALEVLETDERICVARLLAVRIRKAGEQLLEIERLDRRYVELLSGTGMEPGNLGQELIIAAQIADEVLTFELSRQVWHENGQVSKHNQIERGLTAFLRQFLSDRYAATRDMLRLWQVTEVYCLNSNDSLMAELYERSKIFRQKCVQILSDFESLGVRFHQIRFLEDPTKKGLTPKESPSVPPIQSNERLFKLIQSRLDSNFGNDYWRTVADVDSWGLECELDPERNCETELWLWRALSSRSHER